VRWPLPLLAALAGFVVLLGLLVASSVARPHAVAFPPREVVAPRDRGSGPDTLTVDASNSSQWRFVDLDRGWVKSPPDTAGWDLAIRRFHVIAAEAIADAGVESFAGLARPPVSGYAANTLGSDTTNSAIRRWYSYRMLSHLLVPKGHIYVVKTREGRFAKVELISYYCPGLLAGCLTFRYQFLP
jgi:hypothetical protein